MAKKETNKAPAIEPGQSPATETTAKDILEQQPAPAPGTIPAATTADLIGNNNAPAPSAEPAQAVNAADLIGGESSPAEPTQAPADPFPGNLLNMPTAPAEPTAPADPRNKGKRGRPFGSRNKKPGDTNNDGTVNFSDIDGIAQITPEAAATDYQALAEMSFDMSTGTLAVMFGNEWQPKNGEERNAVVISLKRYFEHKQVKDIPPGALLALVVCAYAAPRFNTPTTKDKVKIGWLWLKSKFQRKAPKQLPQP